MEISAHHIGDTQVTRRHTKKAMFEWLIVALLSLSLLVDSLNGFLVLKVGLPSVFSALYKQGVLLLLILYALRYSSSSARHIFMLLSVILAWAVLRLIFVDNMNLLFSFQEAVKALFFFFVVIVVSAFRHVDSKYLSWVIWALILTLLINIASSYLGIGFFSYGKYGAKGFLYGGNAASSVIVICASYLLTVCYRRSVYLFFTAFIFLFSIALIMGTKSGILGVLVCAFLVMMLNLNAKTLLVFLTVITAFGVLVVVQLDNLLNSAIVDRLIYFYNSGGLERALLSGREDKFRLIMPLFLSGNIAYLLFGVDRSVLLKLPDPVIELDFFDMLVFFGTPFTVLILCLYFAIFVRLFMHRSDAVVQACIISIITLFLVSSIAGHVIFNGIVTPIWGTLIGFGLARVFYLTDEQKRQST